MPFWTTCEMHSVGADTEVLVTEPRQMSRGHSFSLSPTLPAQTCRSWVATSLLRRTALFRIASWAPSSKPCLRHSMVLLKLVEAICWWKVLRQSLEHIVWGRTAKCNAIEFWKIMHWGSFCEQDCFDRFRKEQKNLENVFCQNGMQNTTQFETPLIWTKQPTKKTQKIIRIVRVGLFTGHALTSGQSECSGFFFEILRLQCRVTSASSSLLHKPVECSVVSAWPGHGSSVLWWT